jgi:gliding motility-associated-like protein
LSSGLSCAQCNNVTFTPGAGVVAGDAFVFSLKDQSGTCSVERLFEVKYGIPESLNLPNQRVCKGQSVSIEAPKGGTYQWAGPGVKNEPGLSAQLLTPNVTTNYKLTVTFSGGCSKTAEVLVTVLPSDSTILPALSTCKGNPKLVAGTLTDIEGIYYNKLSNYNGCDSVVVQQLLVKPTATVEGKGLCPNDTIKIFGKPINKVGTYCETFKTVQGCDSTHCVTVTSVPGPKLTKPDSAIIEIENSIQLNAAGGFAFYNWLPPTDLSCTDCPSPIAKPKETTNYVLTVKDQNGCEDEVTYRVVVFPPCDPARLLIPNAFTPNGDGVNDNFRVVPFEGIETVFSIQIYDRWGRKVYEKSGQKNIEWDGTVDGEPGLPDVYVWQISINCPLSGEVTKQGGVALLR